MAGTSDTTDATDTTDAITTTSAVVDTENKSYFRVSGMRQKGTEKQQTQKSLAEIFEKKLGYYSSDSNRLIKLSSNINARHLNLTLLALAIACINESLVNERQLTLDSFRAFINDTRRRNLITTETVNFASYYCELYSYIMLVIEHNNEDSNIQSLLPSYEAVADQDNLVSNTDDLGGDSLTGGGLAEEEGIVTGYYDEDGNYYEYDYGAELEAETEAGEAEEEPVARRVEWWSSSKYLAVTNFAL